MSAGTSPNTLSTVPTGEGAGSSRGSSPDGTVEILEHSMESLIISDSSEEGILTEEGQEGLTLRLDLEVGAEQLEVEVEAVNILALAEDEEGRQFEDDSGEILLKGEAQEERKKLTKSKKRRISSRRERKISLSSSDKVVCKIAGVEVGNLTHYASF